jgi:hypothetical protein
MLIILLLFFYYPMIFSPFAHRKQENRLLVYTKADYPYTPRRLILYIIFKTGEIRQSAEDRGGRKTILRCFGISLLPKLARRKRVVMSFFSGFRASTLIALVTGLAFAMKVVYVANCSDCLPPNASKFPEVYVFDGSAGTYYGVLFLTLFGFIFLVVLNSSILFLSEALHDEFLLIDWVSLRSIPVTCFMKKHVVKRKSISMQIVSRICLMFSLKFWCNVYLLSLMVENTCLFYFKLVFYPVNFMINMCFLVLFSVFPLFNQLYIVCLHLLRMCSSRCQYKCISVCIQIAALVLSGLFVYSLLLGNVIYMGMSCMVQFVIYFFFVGIPHIYSTQIHILLLLTGITTYMGRFFLECFLLYRLLLQTVIELKGTKQIQIKDFDTIVRHCCPVSREILFLFAKVFLTSFLLIIMYTTLKELNFLDDKKKFDMNTFLRYAFVLFTPGILETLFFESNSDKVEKMHYEQDEQVRNLQNFYDFQQGIEDNTETGDSGEVTCCKALCLCYCGCLESPFERNGHCKYCYTLKEEGDGDGETRFTIAPFTMHDMRMTCGEYQNVNDPLVAI